MTSTTLPTKRMANAIRVLSMDAVQKANSGHPGMPMGMSEIAVALWAKHTVIIQLIHTGLTAIVLYYRMVTAQCYNMLYST